MDKKEEQFLKEMMPGLVRMLSCIRILALAEPFIRLPMASWAAKCLLVKRDCRPMWLNRASGGLYGTRKLG